MVYTHPNVKTRKSFIFRWWALAEDFTPLGRMVTQMEPMTSTVFDSLADLTFPG